MQWTALWDALILASDQFDDSEDREKVIILLTDWEANKWLDPMIALNYIKEKKENKLKIYTIWIWGLEATYVLVPDQLWNMVKVPISWIDEKTLKTLADSTWGKYFRATDNETLENIFDTIWKLEKKEIEVNEVKTINEKNIIFLYFLIFFMLLFIIFKYRKWI
jgi:Ca-activated chloride channel family protein